MSLSNCVSTCTFKKTRWVFFLIMCARFHQDFILQNVFRWKKKKNKQKKPQQLFWFLGRKTLLLFCGSFPAVVFSDNGDTVFIHQEVLLSVTARDSGGNTSYLKHVSLWDFTIRITVLISNPSDLFIYFFSEAMKRNS